MNYSNNLQTVKQDFKEVIKIFTSQQQELLLETLEFAEEKHGAQMRDEGSPYIIHPIRVAIVLMQEIGSHDINVIQAALLHDTLEDTQTTHEELEQLFGKRVVDLVEALTRYKDQETKLEKHHKTMKAPYEVRAAKSSDCLDNMRSWSYVSQNHPSQQKMPRWLDEAKNQYIPLAETVDMTIADKMRNILEELGKSHE
jgi:(p)ppGpp synthase/HD superfamily hydrolase